jgi:predicted anti-sigma-YlaC factor YlaD
MECRDCKELVIGYSSGEISDVERDLVEAHLGVCEDCSEYLAQSDKLWTLLDEWRGIEPRSDFVSGFWERVSEQERAGYWGFIGRLRYLKPNFGLAGALATIMIVGIFAFALIGPDTGYHNYNYAQKNDEQDELLLNELDNATTRDTAADLAIYGPWDSGVQIMKINGEMN